MPFTTLIFQQRGQTNLSVNERNINKLSQKPHSILNKLIRFCCDMSKTNEELMFCVFSGTTIKKCTPVLIYFLNIFLADLPEINAVPEFK